MFTRSGGHEYYLRFAFVRVKVKPILRERKKLIIIRQK